jgi:hypothetical protein
MANGAVVLYFSQLDKSLAFRVNAATDESFQ